MIVRRKLLVYAALAASAGAAFIARAQGAGKSGRILVGAPAGSQLDLVARLIAERLRELLEQAFIVENRPGATGRIAIQQLRTSEPDGNNLMLLPSGWMTTIPHMRKNNPYDPLTDFTPISKVCSFDFGLAVGSAIPAHTVGEFISWCNANPKLSNLAIPIPGGTLELLAWEFARTAKLDLAVVPYKGGGGDFRTDLIAGRVASGLTLLTDFIGEHQAGRLRVLATTGPARSQLLPDVPTFTELGFRELAAREWYGFVGPARMSQAVESRIAEALQSAVKSPKVLEPFKALGFEATPLAGAGFREEILSEYNRWRDTVKRVDFKPID